MTIEKMTLEKMTTEKITLAKTLYTKNDSHGQLHQQNLPPLLSIFLI